MCMISDEIISVGKTRRFVGVNTGTRQKQITIYSNEVDTESLKNSMILPVPFPESVKFIDMSEYPDIFEDCESSFENIVTRSLNYGRGDYFSDNCFLDVLDVGSYKVSLAKNIQELSNVDPHVFTIPSEFIEMLKENYTSKSWGFIICRLDKGLKEYHPFAYSHNIAGNNVFIPTRHYHKHSAGEVVIKNRADWDHDIYFYNIKKTLDRSIYDSCKQVCRKTHNVKRSKIDFPLGDIHSFEKAKIDGLYTNDDIWVPCQI